MHKTIEELEAELESLWIEFEKIQKDSANKTDTIRSLRQKIRDLKAGKVSEAM
jgi:hypothetical protein